MTEISPSNPLIITVAPNGARKTKQDHPRLPIEPVELAEEALNCMEAGAAMIHLHVRNENGAHSIDVGRYKEAIAAIRDTCGDKILIQATTEAVGIYSPQEQMAMVRELKPESASLAIKELIPHGEEETAREFFHDIVTDGILPHYILYSEADLLRFQELVDKGVIPDANAFLLFVLGRYSEGQTSHPGDLLPFLNVLRKGIPWSVCAFGAMEHATVSAAIALGGHVRVGFENNFLLKNGEVAKSNADLVKQVADVCRAIGRPIATVLEARSILS